MDALGERRHDEEAVLKSSVEASLKSGASVTGALDDAASCLLGGVNLADNSHAKLVSSSRLHNSLTVLIRVPPERSRRSWMNLRRTKRLGLVTNSLFSLCRRGGYWTAMTLNGVLYSRLLGYSLEPAAKALDLGALGSGLSGTGPSVAAVFDPSRREAINGVAEEWSSDGAAVLRTTTNNRKARFLG